VGPAPIVVPLPGLHDAPGVGQAEESVLVKALVPKTPEETLNEGILGRLAGVDERSSSSSHPGSPGRQKVGVAKWLAVSTV